MPPHKQGKQLAKHVGHDLKILARKVQDIRHAESAALPRKAQKQIQKSRELKGEKKLQKLAEFEKLPKREHQRRAPEFGQLIRKK